MNEAPVMDKESKPLIVDEETRTRKHEEEMKSKGYQVCFRCGKVGGAKYVNEKGVRKGITLKKFEDKLVCNICVEGL